MYLSVPFLFPMCFTPHQFIYSGSQNTKMLWLKQLLCYGKRRYFNLLSGAQSVEIELPEVVEGRCGVKGGRRCVWESPVTRITISRRKFIKEHEAFCLRRVAFSVFYKNEICIFFKLKQTSEMISSRKFRPQL